MANDPSTDYVLTAAELPAVRSLLFLQGMGTPVPALDAYCQALDKLLGAYGQIQNSVIKKWFDATFTYLNGTTTLAADINVPVLHMLWHYRDFCNRQVVVLWEYPPEYGPWSSFWDAFVNGRYVPFDSGPGAFPDIVRIPSTSPPYRPTQVGPWPVPASPANWNASVASKMKAWGLAPPGQFVNNSDERFEVQVCFVNDDNSCCWINQKAANGLPVSSLQAQILNSWSGLATVAGQTAQAPASEQRASVLDLLHPTALTTDAYFFLLHALIALPVTTADNQKLAQTVVQTTTTSPEYPNDSFANQLVYLALMHLADPLGNYTMSNRDLQVLLANLSVLITAKDAASTATKQSLDNHGKVLRADAAYPTHDPYNPGTGFNTRVADTLAALDAARQSVKVARQAAVESV